MHSSRASRSSDAAAASTPNAVRADVGSASRPGGCQNVFEVRSAPARSAWATLDLLEVAVAVGFVYHLGQVRAGGRWRRRHGSSLGGPPRPSQGCRRGESGRLHKPTPRGRCGKEDDVMTTTDIVDDVIWHRQSWCSDSVKLIWMNRQGSEGAGASPVALKVGHFN
ncbi:hypothetical protein MRX96_014499 [Rhipicephalus microplus]